MKIVETYEITALEAFACYAAYGDTDGLEQDEIEAFDRYFDVSSFIPAGGNAVIELAGGSDAFARCEVTNTHGGCIEYRIVILAPE